MGGLANGAALKQSFPFGAQGKDGLQFLWVDGERVFHRGCRENSDGGYGSVLVVLPAAERALPATLERLAHEYALRDELDAAWAARPLALVREGGRTALLLEDPGGEPLEGSSARRWRRDASCASPSASPRRWARRTSAASSTRTSSRPISW
jgi:hypothetical protein